jgi:hypothetical protein
MALETGIPLHRGAIEEPGGEVLLPGTSRDSKRGFLKRSVSLYGVFAREPGHPEGYVKKGSGNRRLSP